MEPEIKNAKIEGTMLGIEDHEILTCMVYLDYSGSGQGFGGWPLDEPLRNEEGEFVCRRGAAIGMQFIRRILEVVEVENWEDLKGRPCRVFCDHKKIYKIGHYLKDKWFDPMELGFK